MNRDDEILAREAELQRAQLASDVEGLASPSWLFNHVDQALHPCLWCVVAGHMSMLPA